jgi:hypothetical protein
MGRGPVNRRSVDGVLSQRLSAYPTLSVVTRLHSSTDDYLSHPFRDRGLRINVSLR